MLNKPRVLDLFSGIGGFSLGLERAGFETAAFCEIGDFPRKVLAKHWPSIPIYTDVRELTKQRLDEDGITVDVITGGFPCQDLSFAGKQAGIEAERSGLFSELTRLISELQPRYAIMENVSALLIGDSGRWFGRVLSELEQIGYDAEWHCIQPCYVGIPQNRDRVWICAYPKKEHVDKMVVEGRLSRKLRGMGSDDVSRVEWTMDRCRMARANDGIPNRLDRFGALGNSVVPQIPELIGRAIMEIERDTDKVKGS